MRIDHINALDRSYQCTARYLAHSGNIGAPQWRRHKKIWLMPI